MTVFLDTNVVLYLLADDPRKAARAEELVAAGAVISVQVLNEWVAVARRKLALNWREIDEALAILQSCCTVQALTVEVHTLARRLAERHALAWYDALIVAAALAAGCETLFSEDMHDGLQVENTLTVRNPFRSVQR